jgi:hypothetical protein
MEDDIRGIWKERKIIRERNWELQPNGVKQGVIQKWEQDEERYVSIKVGMER